VIVFVALDHHDPVGLIYGEIEPGELFRALPTELDDGLSVGSIARRLEELIESLLLFLPPLMGPLRVVTLEMPPQIAGLNESGLAALRHADARTVVVVDHLEMPQIRPFRERFSTAGGITFVRSFAGVNPLVLGGFARCHRLTALLEPA
jgi:hypothetical protein